VPQINDTTGGVKTSSIVRVDMAAEGFARIAVPRGTVDIVEGGLFVRNASGEAALPDGFARQVFINFSNPNAPQTKDQQAIHVAGQGATFSVELSSGGYSGVNGTGIRIGLPFTDQFFVAASLASIETDGPNTRLTLLEEADSAAARFGDIKFGYPSGASGALRASPSIATESDLCFGIVEFIEGELIWFTFTSLGFRN